MSPFIPPFDIQQHLIGPWSDAAAVDHFWMLLMAMLVAVSCGWIGCYLVLQRMALIGDAISHTVLLGIVAAFLITGQITGIAIFIGASLTGVLTAVAIQFLHQSSRIKEDAAIGIVFTSLFALGVVLLSTFAHDAHIDTHHVLFGDIGFALLEQTTIAGWRVPLGILNMALVAAVLLLLIVAFYKELLAVAFDPQMSAVLGLRPSLYHYGLMAVLSVTVVNAFTSVGAILVVGMLIAPAATALLLTTRLSAMLAVSALVGILASVIGFHLAYWLDVSVGGSVVTAAFGLFLLAFCFSPQQGLVAVAVRRLKLRWRMSEENVVRNLLKLTRDQPGAAVSSQRLAQPLEISPLRLRWILAALAHRGWIERSLATPADWRLTPQGHLQAERLDRAHRLWETYLVEQVGLPSDHVHEAAEEVKHLLSDQLVERVDDQLGHPDIDPHGSHIPRSTVADLGSHTFTLSKLRVGDSGWIVGLDESQPPEHLQAAAALTLPLGTAFRVIQRDLATTTWQIELDPGQTLEIPHHLADCVLVKLQFPVAE